MSTELLMHCSNCTLLISNITNVHLIAVTVALDSRNTSHKIKWVSLVSSGGLPPVAMAYILYIYTRL